MGLYHRVMAQPKLAKAEESALVLIDIQERLAAVMPARAAVVRGAGILLQAAACLKIPVFLTEQYPAGLGPTVADVDAKIPEGSVRVEKTSFSACGALTVSRPQVVIAGMEAHVCVLQTALEMTAAGHEVFVVADAVCSRTEANSANALARMQAAGVVVTNTESVLFEWLKNAEHQSFRALSRLIR
jgi:nicotinamidase-related amidase